MNPSGGRWPGVRRYAVSSAPERLAARHHRCPTSQSTVPRNTNAGVSGRARPQVAWVPDKPQPGILDRYNHFRGSISRPVIDYDDFEAPILLSPSNLLSARSISCSRLYIGITIEKSGIMVRP